MEGNICGGQGDIKDAVTTGKADWKVWLNGSFYLKSTEITFYLGAVCEEIDFAKTLPEWKTLKDGIDGWGVPQPLEPVVIDDFMKTVCILKRFQIKEREIPLLYEKEDRFEEELPVCNGNRTGILKDGKIVIKAGKLAIIVLDAKAVKNGYPRFHFQEGRGNRICITNHFGTAHSTLYESV